MVKPEPKPSQPSTAKDFFGNKSGKDKTTSQALPVTTANGNASNASSKEGTPNPPTLKRESSSIFKAFAKSKPKEKQVAAEDEPMNDVALSDDDQDEEETYVPPKPKDEDVGDGDRKTRKEREEALRKMMEEDDEEEEPSAAATPDVIEEDEIEEPVKEKSVEPKPTVTVSGGRRRGRRRVMKKRTMKDEEGYLGMSNILFYFIPGVSA